MSFLTEYFDKYREFRNAVPSKIIRPEERYVILDGKWLDVQSQEKIVWTPEEVDAFIKETLGRMRGCSTYRDDYCSRHPPEMKTRKPVPKPKKKCKEKLKQNVVSMQSDLKKTQPSESELIRQARELYIRDPDRLFMMPLAGQYRLFGAVVPRAFQCGLSEYEDTVSRLGYEELIRKRTPQPPSIVMPELQFKMDVLPYENNRC